MPQVHGSCLCGKITYTVTTDPKITIPGTFWDHSKDTKTHTGSAFGVFTTCPELSIQVKGSPRSYTTKGIERSFCPNCGSSIASFSKEFPSLVRLCVGTLDVEVQADIVPECELQTKDKSPWIGQELDGYVKVINGAPRVDGKPFKL